MKARTRATVACSLPRNMTLGSMLFLARYESNPLENDVRRRIYDHVQEYPGLHLSEIARNSEIDTNHAKYHLRVLEDNDFVSSKRQDGYWRFYPRANGSVGRRDILQPEEKEWLSLLRREIPLHITLLLLDRGEANGSEIQDALDIAASTVHYHASKMEDATLLESRKDGRKRVYGIHDPEKVEDLVREHKPPDVLVEGFLEGWEELEFP